MPAMCLDSSPLPLLLTFWTAAVPAMKLAARRLALAYPNDKVGYRGEILIAMRPSSRHPLHHAP